MRTLNLLLILLLVVSSGCDHSTPNKDNRKCLDELIEFADTLQVNNVGTLNQLNKQTNNVTHNCSLNAYRNEFKMRSAIVLIVLKFYNYNLTQNWVKEKAAIKANLSKLTQQIIFEYAYLYYGKDKYYEEDLDIDDIMIYLKTHPVYLQSPQINTFYLRALKKAKLNNLRSTTPIPLLYP